MPQASRTVTIHRPIDVVFDFFANVENDTRWRSAVKDIRQEGPHEVGTLIHQKLAGPLGMTIPADMRISTLERPTALGFQVISGPIEPKVDFAFKAVGDSTEVTLSLEVGLSGIKKVLMSSQVQKTMVAELANLDDAKAFLEV